MITRDFHLVFLDPKVLYFDKSQIKNKNVVVSLCGNGQLVAPRVPANLVAIHLDEGSHLLWFVFIFYIPL